MLDKINAFLLSISVEKKNLKNCPEKKENSRFVKFCKKNWLEKVARKKKNAIAINVFMK